jgi:acyl dehydratase
MTLHDNFELTFHFTQEQVATFASVTGDHNPIHLDADYAAETTFKRPIVHGFLAGSVFSRVIGMEFPGPGTVYLSQSLSFRRPMYVDTDYQVRVKVVEVNPQRHTARLETVIVDAERGKPHLTGEALVMNAGRIGVMG